MDFEKEMSNLLGFTPAEDDTDTVDPVETEETTETEDQVDTVETEESTEDVDKVEETETTDSVDTQKKVLPDDQKKETAVDFDTSLSEKSGGKFKTYADIEAAITDAGENAYASDMVRKLNDYVKSGGRTEDFLRTQTVNYKEMGHLEAIKEEYALNNSDLTNEEINLLIEEDYGVGENATEREKSLARIKVKRDGEAAKRGLVEHQQKWAAAPEATKEQKTAASQQQVEAWKSELSEAVDKNAEIAFKVGEDEFKFVPSAEAKSAVKEKHDLAKFWDRYKTESGYDVNKFVRDQYILNNFEDIKQALVVFAKGQGTEEIVDDIKNVDLKAPDNKDKGGGGKSLLGQIGDNIFS